MHRSKPYVGSRWRIIASVNLFIALSAVAASALAQSHDQPEGLNLKQAFEAAWSRQPEAMALAARREAALAQQQAAQAWTPEPASLELAGKTDRLNRNLGAREYEAGVSIPLWLPGERGRTQALAQAEGRALESRTTAAQLRLAAGLREAWWNWHRARVDAASAQAQLDHVQQIAADVRKRLKAGDLAQADGHQAEGAVASAQALGVQAQAAVSAAEQALRMLLVSPGQTLSLGAPELGWVVEPEPVVAQTDTDGHGDLLALRDRAAVAEGQAALAAAQSRANPELILATTRDRSAAGEAWQQTLTVGVRIPFGAGPRQEARLAAARAEHMELQAQLTLERARLAAEREVARTRTDSARLQLAAAERRAQLARETRGFFDKAFRLGESDLPTRLRIEAEAAEAERQAARARVELAAAISAWRQALGLLPQ